MTKQELDTIIERHQHWLKEDCEGWEGMKANLRGTDLSGTEKYRLGQILKVSSARERATESQRR